MCVCDAAARSGRSRSRSVGAEGTKANRFEPRASVSIAEQRVIAAGSDASRSAERPVRAQARGRRRPAGPHRPCADRCRRVLRAAARSEAEVEEAATAWL